MRAEDRTDAAISRAGSTYWDLWGRGWRRGSLTPTATESVFVSLTDFHIRRLHHAPAAWLTGLRLRHSWPQIGGTIGLWLWAEPLKLRSGSVSIWSSEEELKAFIRSERHLAIMRHYRPRMSGTSNGWIAPRFDRAAIWDEAVRQLSVKPLPPQ